MNDEAKDALRSDYDYAWGVLLTWLRPRAVWVNRHTGEATTIIGFADRIERYPDASSQGFRDQPELTVHHTVNIPPGWNGGYGEDALDFVRNWLPAQLAAPLSPEQEQQP